jgi:ribosome-associated protein
MLVVNSRIQIPKSEFQLTYARSSGPGGQNVNKVSSKVVLRWPITHSASLPDDVRRRFMTRFGTRLTGDGELVVTSQRHRDQSRNVADVFDKVREMLAAVAVPPKRRRPTKPTRSSVERRVKGKQISSRKKQLRRRVSDAD